MACGKIQAEESDDHLLGKDQEESAKNKTYQRYKIRWLMLCALFLLNLTNGIMWLTYAPIPGKSAQFFNVTPDGVDWFSISFFITSLVVGLFAIFSLDTFGLSPSVLAGAVLNSLGALLKLVGSIPAVHSDALQQHNAGFAIAMIGQILTAAAQPFLLYAPTKFAMFWFGEKERTMATSLTSMANPLGIAVAFLVSPRVVSKPDDIFTLSWIFLIPTVIGSISAFLTFWRSKPPTPPSRSAVHKEESFFKGIKKVFKQKSFLVLLVVWGFGAGQMNSLLTLLPQILCPFGYPDTFSGLWIGMMIVCGLVGAFVASVIMDYTKRFDEVTKLAFACAILCNIWGLQVFNRPGQEANVAVSFCLFGFFAFIMMPGCLELGVEVTYPVPEATSSGLLWSSAQIFGAVLTFVGPFAAQPLSPSLSDVEQCSISGSVTPKDFTFTLITYLCAGTLAFLLFVLLFHPKYKRQMLEKKESLAPVDKDLQEEIE